MRHWHGDDLAPEQGERALVVRVLLAGLRDVDGNAGEMGQLTRGQRVGDGAGQGDAGHG